VLLTAVVAGAGAQVGNAQDSGSFPSGFPEVRTSSRMVDRAPIFFPPSPPPLGRALPRGALPPGRLTAPPELAAHVNELYYPQLATRLATTALPAKLRTQLDQYLARKRALQAELRAELDRLRPLPAAEREAALGQLARRQAAPLAALETEAEQLRRDLILGDKTWGALRAWHLGDREQRGFSPLEIAQVMRAYVYYSSGLLPAQRRLLREIALELQYAGDSAENAAANQPHIFFPPEPARVLLPDDVPAAVSTQLAQYQTKKSALKKELYDTVFAHDGRSFGFLRGNSLQALAGRQAPALAELEALAEEIRRGLADMPEVAPVAERTPLPPVLHQRVAALLRDVGAAQKDAAEKIDALLADARDLPMQATYRFETEGLKFIVIPSRAGRGAAPSAEAQARIGAVRAKIAAIAEHYGQLLAGFINERDAIRAEAATTLGLTKGDRVDHAISTAMRVATARETEDVYRDYRLALFQPGLSPAQRRLLFDQVVERLELPLPRGELQPITRSPTW
jgi:hypothetical protein